MTEASKSNEEIAYLLTELILRQDQNPKSKEEVFSIYTESLAVIKSGKSSISNFAFGAVGGKKTSQ